MSANIPLVSCIMPTYNRREFVPHAIRYFLRQQYENKELIIIDDGSDKVHDLVPDIPNISYYSLPKKITLGAKLNLACKCAQGDIIANWDDDDWYADWRLQYQVQSLQNNNKQVCGINRLLYFDLDSKNAYQYIYPSNQRVWLLGSSLCFTKELWRHNQFADINVGMDGLFVWKTEPGKILPLANHQFSVHIIHKNNVSLKKTSGAWWHLYDSNAIKILMADDWKYYINGRIKYPDLNESSGFNLPNRNKKSTLKNVYACLIHEQPDCIIDLIKNLHYNDPCSTILLYNGGTNHHLIPAGFPLEKYNALVHPSPQPVKHGYLHSFALKSMEFALNNLSADILTIVDSDQLSIQQGYSMFMNNFFSGAPNIGMLSSSPQRINQFDKTNAVALQAFKEYDLWKPLLKQFKNGEESFVHWTFWPSTVFTKAAMHDVAELFNTNSVLQDIMHKTKIWASEEVILPTLVKLLGYEIQLNPCSYELVRYRRPVQINELKTAINKPDVHWVHPVTRSTNDIVRKFIRSTFNEYIQESEQPDLSAESFKIDYDIEPVLQKIKKIQGWLNDAEASLLANCCIKALHELPQPHNIVEVGSYHGKATVLLGTIIKDLFPLAKLTSIDPHDGKQGARDQGLKKYPPSINNFKKNIAEAGLENIVEIIQSNAGNVQWQQPISFLFIDGLHDYESVSTDFNHFADCIVKGGYIAFHDYADYFPGVKKLVKELLTSGCYKKIITAEAMIIIKK